MTFFTVVMRGLIRRPVRTGLTLLGISIGIGAVVALVGISRGFSKSWETGLKARGTDIVFSNLASSLTPKPFDASSIDRVAHLPHVAAASGLLVDLTSVESAQMMMVSARAWGGFSWENLKITQGRLPRDEKEQAAILGTTAADVLKKKVGDKLQLETAELTVVGIFDGGAWVENGAVVLSLPLYQEITGNQGKVNIIDIRVTPGTTKQEQEQLCAEIDKRVADGHAHLSSEHTSTSQAYKMAQGMSWGTSLLAIVVGVLGVMNTMLMTVFERTQEISVLLAIGWRRGRIMRMVLLESAMLGLLGGIVGVVIGAIGVKFLERTPQIRGLLEADVSPGLLGVAVAMAIGVGVLSGLYPAWRSSRLTPSRAMQG